MAASGTLSPSHADPPDVSNRRFADSSFCNAASISYSGDYFGTVAWTHNSIHASAWFLQHNTGLRMYLRLQKIDHTENTWRWYVLSVQRTLFGEWAVVREWGRIGNAGGQRQASYFDTLPDALVACDAFRARKAKRGYAALPEQLDLPL